MQLNQSRQQDEIRKQNEHDIQVHVSGIKELEIPGKLSAVDKALEVVEDVQRRLLQCKDRSEEYRARESLTALLRGMSGSDLCSLDEVLAGRSWQASSLPGLLKRAYLDISVDKMMEIVEGILKECSSGKKTQWAVREQSSVPKILNLMSNSSLCALVEALAEKNWSIPGLPALIADAYERGCKAVDYREKSQTAQLLYAFSRWSQTSTKLEEIAKASFTKEEDLKVLGSRHLQNLWFVTLDFNWVENTVGRLLRQYSVVPENFKSLNNQAQAAVYRTMAFCCPEAAKIVRQHIHKKKFPLGRGIIRQGEILCAYTAEGSHRHPLTIKESTAFKEAEKPTRTEKLMASILVNVAPKFNNAMQIHRKAKINGVESDFVVTIETSTRDGNKEKRTIVIEVDGLIHYHHKDSDSKNLRGFDKLQDRLLQASDCAVLHIPAQLVNNRNAQYWERRLLHLLKTVQPGSSMVVKIKKKSPARALSPQVLKVEQTPTQELPRPTHVESAIRQVRLLNRECARALINRDYASYWSTMSKVASVFENARKDDTARSDMGLRSSLVVSLGNAFTAVASCTEKSQALDALCRMVRVYSDPHSVQSKHAKINSVTNVCKFREDILRLAEVDVVTRDQIPSLVKEHSEYAISVIDIVAQSPKLKQIVPVSLALHWKALSGAA